MSLAPPIISQTDPLNESNTSIDPLGLARTYERLADTILPAVTMRMGRIRFVTAMCLGALVCKDYEVDAVASDGVTPAWMVFEWFVIEAFARLNDDVRGHQIPGLLKAQSCMKAQRRLSAAFYLKTPKVFGFHGIFRRLATQAKILTDDLRLDDGGWEILRAWEREQGLTGLIDGSSGKGHLLVRDLRDAVDKGMTEGSTVSRPAAFWEILANALHPGHVRRAEGIALLNRVRDTSTVTREYVDCLRTHGGVNRLAEATYLRGISESASEALGRQLKAIDAYESVCRPLDSAFNLIRFMAHEREDAVVDEAAFSAHVETSQLVDALQRGLARIRRDPVLLVRDPSVNDLLDSFDAITDSNKLFHAVLEHHDRVQKSKPPDGKRSWIERGRNNVAQTRPGYVLTQLEAPLDYVHNYRAATVTGFLSDVGAIN